MYKSRSDEAVNIYILMDSQMSAFRSFESKLADIMIKLFGIYT
jgi:hypothetical protein